MKAFSSSLLGRPLGYGLMAGTAAYVGATVAHLTVGGWTGWYDPFPYALGFGVASFTATRLKLRKPSPDLVHPPA